MALTKQQAEEICDMWEVHKTLEDEEECRLLEIHNPLFLHALKSLANYEEPHDNN